MNLLQKLNKARQEFHALELKKSGENKFAGYKYFELGDFVIPALKVFSDNGIFAFVSFTADLAKMEIYDADCESLSETPAITITSPMGSAALKGCHEVQNIGAVETYQRRYLWMAALEIVEHDALDSSEPVKEAPKVQLPKLTPSEAQQVHDRWVAVKETLVDSEGFYDHKRVDEEWGKLPSNVRTAIKAHGETLKLQQQNDQQAASHIKDI